MAYPDKPTIDTSYTAVEQAQGDGSFPGTELDNDLASLKAAIDEIIDFIALALRSDGALNNGLVTYESLEADLQTAIDAIDA